MTAVYYEGEGRFAIGESERLPPEVAAAEDEDPVEALAADRSDPALGVGPRLRRADGSLDDADSFRTEDLVEVAGELTLAIAD